MASEVIVFPDAEALAITWLTGKIDTVVTYTKVPDPRPDELIKVTTTGGHRLDLAYREAQLTFECWAEDNVRASEIARAAHAHMHAAAGETVDGAYVRKVVGIGGPVNFPDPESTSARYQFTVGVHCRGAAI
jgi:hypothetical protein